MTRLRTILLALILAAILNGPALAQTEGLIITAEAGLDGYCKRGAWLPVLVTVENDGPDIEGKLFARTEDAGSTWDFSVDIDLPSVSRKQVVIYLFPLENENKVVVGLESDGETITDLEIPITCVSETDLIFGVWADNPSVFNTQTAIRLGAGRGVLVQIDGEHIPDRDIGLSMLHSLTISSADTGSLSERQRAAIAGWVANGGRLVIAGGPNWQQTAAGLGDLLPLAPGGTTTLDDFSAVQDYARSPAALAGPAVTATGALHPDGTVLIAQDDIPLVISRKHGFGEVLYFSADPALEPFRTWIGMENLYQLLLGSALDAPTWRHGFTEWTAAGEGLNAIPGLGIPSAWLICGFILLYVVAVGPLNFVVLRTAKRREMAWLTIPGLVILFTGCMFIFGTTAIGSRPILNRLSVVEVWADESMADVHGLIGVFSPGRNRFTLAADQDFLAHPLPEFGFQADRTFRQITQTEGGFAVQDVQVDIGGLESFVVTGRIEAPAFDQDLRIGLENGILELTGEINNRSQVRLEDALILTWAGSISLGDFGPGDSEQVAYILNRSSSPGLSPPMTGSADDTLYEVFGTNYMYSVSSANIEEFRRFKLLSAALGWPNGGRGQGIYLIGWTRESPYEAALSGSIERNSDTTLYVIQLSPASDPYEDASGRTVFTPELFTWALYGTPTGSNFPGAYEANIRTGDFALQYVPVNYPAGAEVESLTLHTEGYGQTGSLDVILHIWNFEDGAWLELTPGDWGDWPLPAPGRFVGPGGQVRVRLTGTGVSVDIERIDFTLTMRPRSNP